MSISIHHLSSDATTPSRGSDFAAGYDLYSAHDGIVPARGKTLAKTDIAIAIPSHLYGRVAPRSGLAWKNSLDVGAGVIDSDYRGNIGVILFNHSDSPFEFKKGDRIAQLIFEKIETPTLVKVEKLEDLDVTTRGEGGYGSTGVSTPGTTGVSTPETTLETTPESTVKYGC